MATEAVRSAPVWLRSGSFAAPRPHRETIVAAANRRMWAIAYGQSPCVVVALVSNRPGRRGRDGHGHGRAVDEPAGRARRRNRVIASAGTFCATSLRAWGCCDDHTLVRHCRVTGGGSPCAYVRVISVMLLYRAGGVQPRSPALYVQRTFCCQQCRVARRTALMM